MAREQGRDPESFATVRKARERLRNIALPSHLLPYWEAFHTLQRGRQMGFSAPQRLRVSDVEACRVMLDIAGPRRFCAYMQAMDDTFLDVFLARRSS